MSELHEAAFSGNLAELEACLKKGSDPNQPDPEWGGRTPLHIACAQGHKKCAYVLINAGAKVNGVTDTGWTPAHSACETGQAQCLSTLMVHNADLSIKDSSGDSAERVAEVYDQKECLRVIREHCFEEVDSSSRDKEQVVNSTNEGEKKKKGKKDL